MPECLACCSKVARDDSPGRTLFELDIRAEGWDKVLCAIDEVEKPIRANDLKSPLSTCKRSKRVRQKDYLPQLLSVCELCAA